MSTNKEERAALTSRIGNVKKRKAEVELSRVFAPKPSTPPLRSILTNGTSAHLPLTPPDSSPSPAISPRESKRKRGEESGSLASMSKKTKRAHEYSNVEESNGNKRKYTQATDELDKASPRKRINNTPSLHPPRPTIPQKSPHLSNSTNNLRISAPITDTTNAPPVNTAPHNTHYTPTNPPPHMRFAGLRWNPAIHAWDSRFTPLHTTSTDSPHPTLTPLYPFTLNPNNPRAPTIKRKVLLPHDPSLDNRWRNRLAEIEEEEARKGGEERGRRQQWEWEIDGIEEEEGQVVEGKSGSPNGDREGSQEGRLDAVKAEELRARATRRGMKNS
ncbi:hypothetical protein E2P81_ATG02135 [Venturia nashicola]|nr:hypothetical protein E2P81_ATG02135 [Venturia nashicola]